MILDLDNFKRVNDSFGHGVGDLVLKHFASVLKSSVREIDLVARLGGEEFGILLPNTNVQLASKLAERVRLAVEKEHYQLNKNQNIKVTISIGVASLRRENETLENILKTADEAMYQAKNQGRNKVAVKPLLGNEKKLPGF